ncbi:NfeD family protein [Prolixibacter denitrificans]|uniref:Membrane-bound serine protease (ClpP class) n=1 Tax=Prolixibacter denitrificans TaxID=1541063 RepID=A0A2P8C8X9_9BACT|nr:NfeD family protein [Prolixibacter denitrificans]PSK81409.1 membrane-bound serine protease (ClpP class) [Prolixibacter denitrificans]GET21120.1 hypothetical protein JCM18694_13660 [Prolixibacter denitrificans]
MKIRLLTLLILLLAYFPSKADDADSLSTNSPKVVLRFNIDENIAPAVWRKTKQAFAEADSLDASLIVIHLNTYGGTVLDADSIRTKILNSKIPVYAFVDNNAASAGALIALSCDSVYMREGANMGAATVVNQTGQAMPDKYQSYMRSIMRATAEAHGKDTIISGQDTIVKWRRDPKIAEAMVDQSLYIPGIIDTGKVLTMTPTEAIKYGFCEGMVSNIQQVIDKAHLGNYVIKEYKPTVLEEFIGFLVHPMVSGILILAILGGIYFELQTPGIGFPLGVAVFAALLYFAPLYLEGLAANWEILLFIIGLILIAVEIFIIPGFGVAGILGIIFAMGGLILSMVGNDKLNFEGVSAEALTRAVVTVLGAFIVVFFFALYATKIIFAAHGGPFRNLALNTAENRDEGFVGVDAGTGLMIGKTGVAVTVLRPAGKVQVENDIYDARAESGFIERGEKVKVIQYQAGQLHVVRKK